MNKTILFFLLFININLCFGQIINPPERKLTQIEIENKSVSELWVLRNSIFAKHGRTFKTYELHALFMKQSWYKPSKSFKRSNLSQIDLFNIDLLHTQEKILKKNNYLNDKETKRVKFENVYNAFQYPSFNNYEKEKLSKNGFLVYPTDRNQLFHIYENNDYLGIPSFISADAVLQLYHLYFGMTLRNIETKYLSSKLETLLDQLINELLILQKETPNQNIKEAVDFNLAFLGISKYFIKGGNPEIKGSLQEFALEEIKKCTSHNDRYYSELLCREFDYTQFVPRGHYTRSEKLKGYFLSMMWLGNAGITIKQVKDINQMCDKSELRRNTLASVLITNILYNKTHQGKPLIELWKDIYEPTVFYVGLSDDTGPIEIKQAMDVVFPGVKIMEKFDNKEKLLSLTEKLPNENITANNQDKQFRFMGQRFIPDSEIFQRLTIFPERVLPNSLDIMAGFGNKKAYDLMVNNYKPSWTKYPDTLRKIIKENKEMTKSNWTQNLYYHWLYNLKALYEIKDKSELPFFMKTDAWDIKTLNTSLASWSELRHNTILYAKQSETGVECGGDGNEIKAWIPEPPKGYVEPNTEFYDRMLSLMNFTKQGLTERGMLDSRLKYIGNEFIDLLTFLKSISEKENRNEKLSLEEYDQIQKLGSLLENLTLRVLEAEEWSMVEGPDKNMPVIADVHTYDNKVLEVGVGKALAIYVIVEIEGKLKLTRGAIFSFYEFPWSSSDRLTDKKWQKMLENGNAPEQPEWINYKSNLKQEKSLTPLYKPDISDVPDSSTEPGWNIIYYDTGC